MESAQDIIRTVVGKNLRTLRQLRNLPQKAVGAFIGVTFQQMQKYEKGINSISAEKLLLLSVALQYPVQDMFKGALKELEEPGHTQSAINSTKVGQLIADFSRIRSPEMRDQITSLVKQVANLDNQGK